MNKIYAHFGTQVSMTFFHPNMVQGLTKEIVLLNFRGLKTVSVDELE